MALVAAAVLGACLSGCGAPASAASTALAQAVHTAVVLPSGRTVNGWPGELLAQGAVVRTGPAGRAILDTGGRMVWLGANSTLRVVDGTQQSLRAGSVVIDARSGPPLRLQVSNWAISPAPGSAVRVVATFATRVGVLVGSARIVGSVGSEQVFALHQLLATALALPSGDLPPLQLTDDRAEKSVAPGLVADDVYLRAEALDIDTTPSFASGLERAARVAVQAAFVRSAPQAASESVLPLLIAKAARGGGGLIARYRRALALRQAGGSWGVIAHLLGARALRTAGELQALLVVATTAHPLTALGVPGASRPGGAPTAGVSFAPSGSGASANSPSAAPSPGGSTSAPAPAPSSPAPTPASPTSTSSAQQVLNTVSGLLPPLPAASPTPGVP